MKYLLIFQFFRIDFGVSLMERVKTLTEENTKLAERIDMRNAENELLNKQISNFDQERNDLFLKFQSFIVLFSLFLFYFI